MAAGRNDISTELHPVPGTRLGGELRVFRNADGVTAFSAVGVYKVDEKGVRVPRAPAATPPRQFHGSGSEVPARAYANKRWLELHVASGGGNVVMEEPWQR